MTKTANDGPAGKRRRQNQGGIYIVTIDYVGTCRRRRISRTASRISNRRAKFKRRAASRKRVDREYSTCEIDVNRIAASGTAKSSTASNR